MTTVQSTAATVAPGDHERPTYDVVVIGGGVHGTGVARDCALRGMRVALFEKHDWGFGASGNSSGVIDGGARYLTGHPSVTELSCRDGGLIQRIAPHLAFRIPFLFPIPARGLASRLALAAVDAFFAYYDRYQPLKRGKRHEILRPEEARALEPGLVGEIAGAITFDEWGIDGVRLCLANVACASEHGARCHAHHEVTEILRHQDGTVRGVVARDRETGARTVATARRVVNATGAWGPRVAGLAGASAKVRLSKGIHVLFDRRIGNCAVVCRAIDGRLIFSMPWQNLSLLGTTDDDYDGDLDDVRATTDEVRYLVEGVARTLPEVARARVIGTTAGVRPTLHGYGPHAEIIDHAADGAPGLYSMIGGRLATYRIFAAEMGDRLARDLEVASRSTTHEVALPGGEAAVDPLALAERMRVSEITARRLVHRHGCRVEPILSSVTSEREQRAVVCSCEPVIEAEVRHAVRVEGARDVADVARRTRLGLGSCGGMRCAHRCAQIVAAERHLAPSVAHAMAAEFLAQRFRSRAPALDGAQARAEEIAIAKHLESGLGEGAARASGAARRER